MNLYIKNLILICFILFSDTIWGQVPRQFSGDFDYKGNVNAETLSATGTVTAASFVAGASNVEINIRNGNASKDGYGLIFDQPNNQILLEPLTGITGFLIQSASSDVVSTATTVNIVGSAVQAITSDGGGGAYVELVDTGITGVDFQDSGVDVVNSATLNVTGDLSLTSVGGIPTLNYTDSGGGSGGGSGAYPIFVASVNASATEISQADYLCDGVDDHVQINTALTEAGNLSNGGIVRLSGGDFYAGASIDIATSHITFEGAGQYTTRIHREFSASSNFDNGVVRVTEDVTHLNIKNLGINGNKITFTDFQDGNLVTETGNGASYAVYENLYLYNAAGRGMLFLTPDDNFYVTINNVISYQNGYGFDIDAEHATLINCYAIDNTGSYGFYINDCLDVSVIGCHAYLNDNTGFGFSSSTTQLTVLGCVSSGNTDYGFEVDSDEVSFVGNVSNANNGISNFRFTGDYYAISGNVSRNADGDGFGVYCSFSTFDGNTDQASGDDGIVVDGEELVVSNNYVDDPADMGFNCNTVTNLTLIGNKVVSPIDDAFFIDDCPYAVVSENMVYDLPGSTVYGIYIVDSDNSELTDNKFYDLDGTDTAIRNVGSDLYLSGNQLIGSWAGLYAEGGTNPTQTRSIHKFNDSDSNPYIEVTGGEAGTVMNASASAVPSGSMSAGQFNVWLDETNHELEFQVKYSDGTTVRSGVVTLSP